MSDTQQVLEAAEKLGQILSDHPATKRFKDAQRALAQDADAARLMAEFDRGLHRLVQQQQQGIPVTDAQQQQLEALQTRVVSHIKIKALNMAQVEYADLRRRIGQTIDKVAQGVPEAAPAAGAAAPANSAPAPSKFAL